MRSVLLLMLGVLSMWLGAFVSEWLLQEEDDD